jgi:hypothetical protein
LGPPFLILRPKTLQHLPPPPPPPPRVKEQYIDRQFVACKGVGGLLSCVGGG